MPSTHALLSPSSAHRWLNCTAAPLLEKDAEDKGSTFAEEGTLAHAYCAKKLKTMLGLLSDEEDREIASLESKYHTGEMDECTEMYRAIVWEKYQVAKSRTKDAQLLVEVHLDFGKYIPGSFGTSDAVIIADGTLEVIDFKYGKGVKVDAVENPQMKIYALGAWEMFNFEYDIRKIRMTIVQPRLGNISEYCTDTAALLDWAESELKRKAEEAYKGGTQKPGAWCQFCKVKASCRALADTCLGAHRSGQDPKLISKEDMESRVLPMLATIKTWLAGVEEYTLQQALDGVEYKGFKLVEGRSTRRITDTAAVMDLLCKEGYSKDTYVEPTKLRSITDLEKLIGKKRFGTLCAEYITKPQGKPALVPDTDKRPAFNTAAEDFKNL